METAIPSAQDIRAKLSPLSLRQLEQLALVSGVPFTTLYKIKRGETSNPGVDTIRRFLPHVAGVSAAASDALPEIGAGTLAVRHQPDEASIGHSAVAHDDSMARAAA